MRNRSQKNAETLLLEAIKNKEKSPKSSTRIAPTSSRNKTAGPSDGDTHAKKQHPSRFCAQAIAKLQPEKNHQKLLPLKTKKSCPSHAKPQGKPSRNVRLGSVQATRQNSRKRCLGHACEKNKTPAGFVPKPLRNYSRKNAETLLLDAFGTH